MCVVEPTHMGVTGGKVAIRVREARVLLDREKQFRHRLSETPTKKMRGSYYLEGRADPGARTESQRSLGMLDRDVELAGPIPEYAANEPAAGVIRVERQGTIDQRHHRADVLAEIGKPLGGMHQDAWVIAGRLQR